MSDKALYFLKILARRGQVLVLRRMTAGYSDKLGDEKRRSNRKLKEKE